MKKRPSILLLLLVLLRGLPVNAQVVIKTMETSESRPEGVFKSSTQYAEINIEESEISSIIQADSKSKNLDHGLGRAINLTSKLKWQTKGESSFARIKISIPNVPTIRLNFSKLDLPESAEMYIYCGTTTIGPIKRKDSARAGNTWSTSFLPDSTVFVEVKSPTTTRNAVNLILKNVRFGYRKGENKPAYDSKFLLSAKQSYGESASCEVNAKCSYSIGYEAERSGVALINTSTEAATGFLVNDACNSMKPYLITAKHVTDGETIGSMTFTFSYMSNACTPTTNGSTSLLFNGGTLRSSWDPADISLIELYDPIPIGSTITFLGWTRSTTAPSSTICFHHPKGDVMKVAVDNDAAILGPIDLYTNYAWQVQFDIGTTEAGSSGSPLINSSHQVVGVDHGAFGGLPCSGTASNVFGRFDLAWDGGGTSGSRLKDWLDPNGTNLSSASTLDPSSQYAIQGVDYFCSGPESFTVNSLPSGASFGSWTLTQPYSIASMSTSSATATLTKIVDGVVTLSASLYNTCSANFSVSKTIQVGNGNPPTGYLYYDDVCGTYLEGFGSSPPINATGYIWREDYSSTTSTSLTSPLFLSPFISSPSNGASYTHYFEVAATTSCGTTAYSSPYPANVGPVDLNNCNQNIQKVNPISGKLVNKPTVESSENLMTPGVYPNPAHTYVTIVVSPEKISIQQAFIKIVGADGRILKRIQVSGKINKVYIGDLLPGLYIIEIADNKRIVSNKLIKN